MSNSGPQAIGGNLFLPTLALPIDTPQLRGTAHAHLFFILWYPGRGRATYAPGF